MGCKAAQTLQPDFKSCPLVAMVIAGAEVDFGGFAEGNSRGGLQLPGFTFMDTVLALSRASPLLQKAAAAQIM